MRVLADGLVSGATAMLEVPAHFSSSVSSLSCSKVETMKVLWPAAPMKVVSMVSLSLHNVLPSFKEYAVSPSRRAESVSCKLPPWLMCFMTGVPVRVSNTSVVSGGSDADKYSSELMPRSSGILALRAR